MDLDNIERIVIRPWFDRFDTLNKGILRIISLVLVINLVLLAMAVLTVMFDNPGNKTYDYIIIMIITHFGIIVGLKIFLWVFDGFINP